ncbi:putative TRANSMEMBRANE PROTEIN [Candidatus Burkholderia verschuerenii]|uniref:Putative TRANSMEMBRANE PROTEIN n=1 Tax=Candidatus Burkholderia verschuerenii TaxID=242163 RepID=A0A0L0MCW5_9BURK|nr:hypothetical protein [Candidatus Burkholderia verschuerenii]KND60126.1 putative TRANSMEMBRANE PROTEIN [Candidatus Burkholderia verschuerenii]
MKNFPRKNPVETLLFVVVFAAVLTQLKYRAIPATQDNLEQWINISNEMFYGAKDFVFSYGPLYWVTGPAPSPLAIPAFSTMTYWAGVVFCASVFAYFWAAIGALIYRSRACLLFVAAIILHVHGLAETAAFFLWPLVTVYYVEYVDEAPRRFGRIALVTLGILSGVAFYVRFFYGMLAVATFASYLVSRFRVKGTLTDLLCFGICAIGAYIVAGLLIFHDAQSLKDYLVINSQLNFGNSVDMTLPVINYCHVFVFALLPVLIINLYAILYRRTLWLTTLGLQLVFFKIGFSRTDHYLDYFVTPVIIVSLFLLFEGRAFAKICFVLSLCCLTHLAAVPAYPGAVTHAAFQPVIEMSTPYSDRMAKVYADFKLPENVLKKIGNASVDVYPYNNEYLFANKLNYHQRPLFQNYMTLTPKLDSLNRQFLTGNQRPDYMLWTAGIACRRADCNPFDGIDGKYVLNEDPLTSTTILANYNVVDRFSVRYAAPAILLQKNRQIRHDQPVTLPSERMEFAHWYSVPENKPGGVIKLVPQLKFTLLGRLNNLFFRGRDLSIKYRLATGEIKHYRLNILNTPSGIWASPFLDRMDLSGQRVKAIMLEAPDAWYFQRTFGAIWQRIDLPALRVRPPEFAKAVAMGVDKQASTFALQCEGSIDTINQSQSFPSSIGPQDGLSVRGWLAVSTQTGTTPGATFVSLTDAQPILRRSQRNVVTWPSYSGIRL